ncbi:MAG: hypothetical protein H6R01_983 [Burkholderiaceae bacterium]|nr:hypothetical protein [Burkholderiaceae bacterium]
MTLITIPDDAANPDHQTIQQIRRQRLLLRAKVFVVLVCLTLLIIIFWQNHNVYNIGRQHAKNYAANLTNSLAQQTEATFKQADTILLGLVERVETDGTRPANLRRLESLLVQHVTELPKLHGLFIYDEHGRWLANSMRRSPVHVNNADRDYFIYLSTHTDAKPFIGKPVKSRSTDEWILTIARRLNHADGRFAGVVLATIRLDYFNQQYNSYRLLGPNSAIALDSAKGILLLRRPFDEKQIGMDISNAPLFREHLPKATSGIFHAKASAIDGQDRLISYRQLDSYPLIQVVSLSQKDLLAMWWRETYPHLLVAAALTLGLGFLGFRLLRQIGKRMDAENELQKAQASLQQLNQELERMAMQDGLTGLANRRQFDLALDEEFRRAMRHQQPLALVMLDVDAFKQYNDQYGHPAGDDCLRKISAVVKACQRRAGDLAARYGGEEIALLLPGTDLDSARAIAVQIQQDVRNLAIAHPTGSNGILTVSCGVDAIVPVHNRHLPPDLLERADKALYAAKAAGRDHVMAAPATVHMPE